MINLHEQLSEFSYGYGVTREVEQLLAASGLHATPFLPNLVHEASLGFDVSFSSPGGIVMLQFKLGEGLRHFRRSTPSQPKPALDRPFWRFRLDMDGEQFQRLEAFEQAGADVYYVAPRFSTWKMYLHHFQAGDVLAHSLLARPSVLAAAAGGPTGTHRVVYDRVRRYVCSEPTVFAEVEPEEISKQVRRSILRDSITLGDRLRQFAETVWRSPRSRGAGRRMLNIMSSDAKEPERALATALGLDAWSQGAQMLFVNDQTAEA